MGKKALLEIGGMTWIESWKDLAHYVIILTAVFLVWWNFGIYTYQMAQTTGSGVCFIINGIFDSCPPLSVIHPENIAGIVILLVVFVVADKIAHKVLSLDSRK